VNVILIHEHEVASDGRVRLDDRRAEHLRQVLRKTSGMPVRVGLVGGWLGTGIIEGIAADGVSLRCDFTEPPPPKRALTVVLALPRPPVLRRLLAQMTSLGVERIVLLQTERVEKSYWDSPALATESIAEQLQLGLEQAVDTMLPQVEFARRFGRFVQDELPGLAPRILVADPRTMKPCPANVTEPLAVVFGPEGGLIPPELERLVGAGAEAVTLGSRILRVETAVVGTLVRLGTCS